MPREEFQSLIDSALRGELTQAKARQLARLGPEAITLALLAASRRIAEQDARLAELEDKGGSGRPSASTPSGMVTIYTKPNTSKRHKKPGAKAGHQGVRRERPIKIDERKTHRPTSTSVRMRHRTSASTHVV